MELATTAPLRFAGLGLMLTQPGFWLAFGQGSPGPLPVSTAGQDSDAGLQWGQGVERTAELASELQTRVAAVIALRKQHGTPAEASHLSRLHVTVRSTLPLHSGLGSGTQLACAVAVGVEFWLQEQLGMQGSAQPAKGCWQAVSQLPGLDLERLVELSGRGLRSAVGLTGFRTGGLVLDAGYPSNVSPGVAMERALRPVSTCVAYLPTAWRSVLIIPQQVERVHGAREANLLEVGARQPHLHAPHMWRLAEQAQELAQIDSDFEGFTDCLERYMRFAEGLFSQFQNGPYNGPEITAAVEVARQVGLRGVGQSSWGPTVFGFAADELQANRQVEQIRAQRPDWSVLVAAPARAGAEVQWLA